MGYGWAEPLLAAIQEDPKTVQCLLRMCGNLTVYYQCVDTAAMSTADSHARGPPCQVAVPMIDAITWDNFEYSCVYAHIACRHGYLWHWSWSCAACVRGKHANFEFRLRVTPDAWKLTPKHGGLLIHHACPSQGRHTHARNLLVVTLLHLERSCSSPQLKQTSNRRIDQNQSIN